MFELLLSVKFAVKSLTDNLGRTLLTLSGIIIGTLAVLSVLSLGDALRGYVLEQVSSFGNDIIQIEVKVPTTRKNSSDNARGIAQGIQITTLTLEDGRAIGKLPNVKAWYGGSIGQELATYQELAKRVSIFGTGPDALVVDQGMKLAEGSFYTESDDTAAAQEAVIGSGVRRVFSVDSSSAVGQFIKIKNQNYRVLGVLEERGSTGFISLDDFVYIPIQTLQKKVLGVQHVSMIQVRVTDETKSEGTALDIEDLLRDRHDITDAKDDDFAVTTMKEARETLDTIFGALRILLLVLASISLLVSGVGIMNVMFVAVTERTTEIGLRKAVGARNKDILRQFLAESVGVALSGGIVGTILGIGLIWLVYWAAGAAGLVVTFAIGWNNIALALSFSFVAGLLFGVYPAWKASQITPINAIRAE